MRATSVIFTALIAVLAAITIHFFSASASPPASIITDTAVPSEMLAEEYTPSLVDLLRHSTISNSGRITMTTPDDVIDLKTFVPAKDFARSKAFYIDLGFTQNWGNDQVVEFQTGAFRFLLQNFYVKPWAENFMMHLMVEDADAWWTHIKQIGLIEKYELGTANPPRLQPWGLRVLFLSDPAGVLWHIADRPTAS